jgi:glycosyltransferase involved in cell wall biosynthesis
MMRGGKLRVGFLSHSAQLGGGEQCLRDLVASLPAHGIEPVVYMPEAGPMWKLLNGDGACCRAVAWPPAVHAFGDSPDVVHSRRLRQWSALPGEMAGLVHALRRQMRVDGIAVLHTNSLKAEVVGGMLGRRWPRLWYLHECISRRPVARWLLPRLPFPPRRVWTCSQAVLQDLASFAPRLQRRARVLYNPLDLARWPPAEERADHLPGPAGHLRVGLIGALTPLKGQHLLLAAAEQIVQRRHDVQFYIVGGDFSGHDTAARSAYAAELQARAQGPALAGHVVFTGVRQDIARVIASLDVCVVASVVAEAFPRSVLEPLAMGRPVVAPNAGGIPEILSAVSPQLLYPAGDAAALAGRLLCLLDDAELRRRTSAAGIEVIRRTYGGAEQAGDAAREYALLAAETRA